MNLSTADVTSAAPIDSRFVTFDGYFDIFDISIIEDITSCGTGCPTLSYLVDLRVNKGTLRLNPSFDSTIVNITIDTVLSSTGYELAFRGYLDDINSALDSFEYNPLCPFDTDNTLTVTITATNYNYMGTAQTVSADIG